MKRIALFVALICGCSFGSDLHEPDADTDTETESDTGAPSEPPLPTAPVPTFSTSSDGTSSGGTSGSDADGDSSTGAMTEEDSSSGEPPCELLFDLDGECTDEPDGMATIESGTFAMGCDIAAEQPDCQLDEIPVHEVTLSTYAIDLTEVTVGAYQDCADDDVCTPRAPGNGCNASDDDLDDHPANCLSWNQAQTYCEWMGKRLPTEAEWEYAAEGPAGNRWPWADVPNPDCDYAVVVDGGPGCGTDETFPVGSKAMGATPTGVLDLVGNVQEWVGDWYADDAYASHSDDDPVGPAAGTQRTIRGSSLLHGMVSTHRVRNRWSMAPELGNATTGFRCAADPRGE